MKSVQWPTCPSPVHPEKWTQFLLAHPDQRFATYIRRGFEEGFHIGLREPDLVLTKALKNHPSALANSRVVNDYITTEVSTGRFVGPLARPVCSLVHTSLIGLVPKSHQVDQWRMIVDLSFPRNHSVNDGIPRDLSSLSYASVDDAVECILALGRGTELVKIDLKNAYRMVPVHPEDHHFLAISRMGQTYIDRALPFGLRSAPKIFSAVADMIAWALHCAGIRHQIHYLDDFLFMGAPNTNEGTSILGTALRVLEDLGVPVANHKTEGPSTSVTFLDVTIDTMRWELRLPTAKVERLQRLVRLWCMKKACTRRELESFLGQLSHAASVVRPGRTFLRQLFSLLQGVKAPSHYVRLHAGARADLAWWKCFLQSWSGSSFFPLPDPSIHVYSDASGTYGFGAVVEGLGWVQGQWPPAWSEIAIACKELVPVVVAAALWGPHWSGKHVRFHSDNMAVVSVLTSRTAKDPLLLHLLRCFSFYCAHFCFHVSARHIVGVTNVVADALSRNNLPLFMSLISQTMQYIIPPSLHELLIATRPDWGSETWTQLFVCSLTEVSPRPP